MLHSPAPLPLTRDHELIGGGHTHALVLRRWGMAPVPGARLTLINPGPTAPYTGMLPGHVAGYYPRSALDIDLARLAQFAGARLILGHAEGIDRARGEIHIAGRGAIGYDIAAVDIGITSDLPALPGFATHGVAAKPLGPFADRWANFRDAALAGQVPAEIAILGAGIAGVELAMAIDHALSAIPRRITVIDRSEALAAAGARAGHALRAALAAHDITLIEGAAATALTATEVTLQDSAVPARFVVGAAGARPHGWLAQTGLTLDAGFIVVDQMLRSVNDPQIYATGDCASMRDAPRPKAGVFAVRQAPTLAHNLRADLTGRARRRYRPQRDYLKLVTLAGRSAMAIKFGRAVAAPPLWRWKDRIDQAFMHRLSALPQAQPPRAPAGAARGVAAELAGPPPCGGCGAKVGGAALAQAIARLPRANRPDIVAGPGDDAALIQSGGATLALTTDHLRAFVDDPWLMARITAIHAMGDIWAMGATPQAALAQIILPPLSDRLAARWLAEIMDAAGSAFSEAGAVIAGGHTSRGAELTLGFTVTGPAPQHAKRKGGARPGDLLVLTKPLGTGALLAGHMRGQARGAWIAEAQDWMSRSQSAAGSALANATAMTDVTGFGLAGHLMEMMRASGTGARIQMAALPRLGGADEILADGIESTLAPANRALVAGVVPSDAPALLFDPQTAGGLLAAIPPGALPDAQAALKTANLSAQVIGDVVEGHPALHLL